MSLVIWDDTVLPATRHKWTHPTLEPQTDRLVLDLPTPEGWKAELNYMLAPVSCIVDMPYSDQYITEDFNRRTEDFNSVHRDICKKTQVISSPASASEDSV